MSLDKTDCLREGQDLLSNINLWKEKTHRQISRIINSHSSSISTGINTLIEEIRGLQNELSVTRKEKAVLLDKVDNLTGEINQLNSRLHSLPMPKKEIDQEMVDTANLDKKMLEVIKEDLESGSIGIEHEGTAANALYETIETISTDEKADVVNHVTQEQTMSEIKIKKFKCHCCPYSSIRKGDLTKHTRKHEKSYVCEQCDFNTSQKSTFNQHTLSAHSEGSRKFPCNQCSYITINRSHIEKHIKAVHKKIKDHICGHCGYAASRLNTLEQHKMLVHKMGEKKFRCELCPYTTYLKQSLTRHVIAMHRMS